MPRLRSTKVEIRGIDVALPSLERLEEEPWHWLQEFRIGLDPRIITSLVLGWRILELEV